MTAMTDGERAARGTCIERTLAQYPHLDDARVTEVIHWFRKEASALDVALLASNGQIADVYRQFRADHIDPLIRRDVIRGTAFALAAVVIGALILWALL